MASATVIVTSPRNALEAWFAADRISDKPGWHGAILAMFAGTAEILDALRKTAKVFQIVHVVQ